MTSLLLNWAKVHRTAPASRRVLMTLNGSTVFLRWLVLPPIIMMMAMVMTTNDDDNDNGDDESATLMIQK